MLGGTGFAFLGREITKLGIFHLILNYLIEWCPGVNSTASLFSLAVTVTSTCLRSAAIPSMPRPPPAKRHKVTPSRRDAAKRATNEGVSTPSITDTETIIIPRDAPVANPSPRPRFDPTTLSMEEQVRRYKEWRSKSHSFPRGRLACASTMAMGCAPIELNSSCSILARLGAFLLQLGECPVESSSLTVFMTSDQPLLAACPCDW